MLTCKQIVADDLKNLNPEQEETLACHFTATNALVEELRAETSILQEVIYKLTGLDSIQAIEKVFGRDIVAEISVHPER